VRHLEIEARPSFHDKYIEVIQSTGPDLNKDLAFAGSGIGNIVIPENICAAMLVKTKGFHLFSILFAIDMVILLHHRVLSITKLHLQHFKCPGE